MKILAPLILAGFVTTIAFLGCGSTPPTQPQPPSQSVDIRSGTHRFEGGTYRERIDFKPHFRAKPQVTVALTEMVGDQIPNDSFSVRLLVENLDATGFTLVMETRRVPVAGTSWVAFALTK